MMLVADSICICHDGIESTYLLCIVELMAEIGFEKEIGSASDQDEEPPVQNILAGSTGKNPQTHSALASARVSQMN